MMPSRLRRRSAWLGFTVLLGTKFLLAFAATSQAQVLNDPRIAEFDPSPDHWAVLDSGQPAVLKYELDLYVVGASTPFGTLDMGKPSPEGDGKIRFDFAAQIAAWSLPGGNYEARVSAVGPEGEAFSDPSNPFTFTAFHSCAVYLTPESVQAAAGGGRYATTVATAAECAWPVATGAAWLQPGTAGGTGNGRVEFDVAANTATTTRNGTITIGDVNLVVTQDAAAPAPCTYSVSPASYSAVAGGASTSFGVTASSSTCAWTAAPSQSWITASSSASGGNGTVSVTVAANTAAAARTGTVSVQGQTFTVTQAAAPCSYSLSAGSATVAASGGTVTFGVTATSGCAWTPASSQSWITASSSASGGNGTVSVTVAANTAAAARTGTVSVQGQTFTVTQAAAPCSYSLSPGSANAPAEGGSLSFTVSAEGTCSWTAAPGQSWLNVSNGVGTGTRTVTVNVAANTAASARAGNVIVEGRTFAVNQAAAPPAPDCSYSVTPAAFGFPATGGAGQVNVGVNNGCTWNVVSDQVWLVPAVLTGSGGGTVAFTVKPTNAAADKTARLTIGPWVVTVTQDGKVRRIK